MSLKYIRINRYVLFCTALIPALGMFGCNWHRQWRVSRAMPEINSLIADLGRYRQDLGRHPDQLDDLIPKYRSSVTSSNPDLRYSYIRRPDDTFQLCIHYNNGWNNQIVNYFDNVTGWESVPLD